MRDITKMIVEHCRFGFVPAVLLALIRLPGTEKKGIRDYAGSGGDPALALFYIVLKWQNPLIYTYLL